MRKCVNNVPIMSFAIFDNFLKTAQLEKTKEE